MGETVIIMSIVFFVLMAIDVPIAVAIALATFVPLTFDVGVEHAARIVAHRMSSGIESFSLLAIPFFIIAGLLMGRGGLARRLTDFASALVGWLPGGLGHVTILTCMLFGAISGSAVAAVSSIGGVMIPEMRRKGYDRDYCVALTTTAATTGLIIPPSNIMIVYALASGGVSIAALFLAGVGPGILFGLALMVAHAVCGGGTSSAEPSASAGELLASFWRALPGLLLILIVLAGILLGIFTATEAAAVSVAYAFLLTVVIYREISLKTLWDLLIEAAVTTSVVLLMVGASMAMSWMLARDGAPQKIGESMLQVFETRFTVLLAINAVLLVVGMFMDITPAVLILTPVFLPVVKQLGVDPIHFGIIMIVNLCIGLCTPPVGTCLYVGCGIGKTSIAAVLRPLFPFFLAMFVALMAITYIPEISLWLPRVLHLIR